MVTEQAAIQKYEAAEALAKRLFLKECEPVDAAYLRRLKEARQEYAKATGQKR